TDHPNRAVRASRRGVAFGHHQSHSRRAVVHPCGTPPRRARQVRALMFDTDELEAGACAATGLEDFGSSYYREGLERIVEAVKTEADPNDLGRVIPHAPAPPA